MNKVGPSFAEQKGPPSANCKTCYLRQFGARYCALLACRNSLPQSHFKYTGFLLAQAKLSDLLDVEAKFARGGEELKNCPYSGFHSRVWSTTASDNQG